MPIILSSSIRDKAVTTAHPISGLGSLSSSVRDGIKFGVGKDAAICEHQYYVHFLTQKLNTEELPL